MNLQDYIKSRLKSHRPISSLSKTLDNFLNGGLNKSIITEFAGQSGSGKTQLALHFAISAQISDELKSMKITKKEGPETIYKSTKICYICGPATPKNLLIKRIEEMESKFIENLNNHKDEKVYKKLAKIVSKDNILWKSCHNFEQLVWGGLFFAYNSKLLPYQGCELSDTYPKLVIRIYM